MDGGWGWGAGRLFSSLRRGVDTRLSMAAILRG